MTDQTQALLTRRLRQARETSRARQVAIARLPTQGISLVMALGALLSAGLLLAGGDYHPGIPVVLAVAGISTWLASRWVERAPTAAGEAGIAITLLATLATSPLAPAGLAVPIGIVSIALIVVGGTLTTRDGSHRWIPLGIAGWWFILYVHPPDPADLVPAAVFPALLLITTGMLVARVMKALHEHDALTRDALGGLVEVGQELELQRERAMVASRAKSAFLTNMSHELRTPLNAIIGYGELILEEPDQLQTEDVEHIVRSGRKLLGLVDDVLQMSRLEAEASDLEPRQVAVRPLFDELHQLAYGLAEERGLQLSWTVDPDLPENVPGEGLRVRQVLLHLIGNAVKFTDAGEVRLHAYREGDRWITRVTDTGPGIPAPLVDQLFVPFTQGSDRGNKHAGSGLGLPIARELARGMRGDVLVETEEGVGTTFSVVLPLVA